MSKSLKVKIATKNIYLRKKLELELFCEEFSIVDTGADITLVDLDTEPALTGAVTMSYSVGADIALPFRIGEVKERLKAIGLKPLSLIDNERSVLLFGEKIKLTELEFSLLSLLYEKRSFVSREEILASVWQGEADGGIVNVYVHYLREKLEKGGEKIIISSRKLGYGISEKFLGGAARD